MWSRRVESVRPDRHPRQVRWAGRVKPKDVVVGFGATVAAHHHVSGAGHGPDMGTLAGGAPGCRPNQPQGPR